MVVNCSSLFILRMLSIQIDRLHASRSALISLSFTKGGPAPVFRMRSPDLIISYQVCQFFIIILKETIITLYIINTILCAVGVHLI